jgi:hypothetical protein
MKVGAKVLPRPQAVQTLSVVPSTHQFPPPGQSFLDHSGTVAQRDVETVGNQN